MNKMKYNKLYNIAESQGGFFAASQARNIGFSWDRLSKNAKSGRFTRVAHGVYRLTKFPRTAFDDLYIAWLRAGLDSVISHESALSVYDLSDVIPSENHVIVPRSSTTRREGIRQHTNRIDCRDITTREGLRITTIPRTLADVSASGLPKEQVLMAIKEGIDKGMISVDMLWEHANKRGGRFKMILQDYEDIVQK